MVLIRQAIRVVASHLKCKNCILILLFHVLVFSFKGKLKFERYDESSDAVGWRIVFRLEKKDYALHVDNDKNNTVTAVEVGNESRFIPFILFTRHSRSTKTLMYERKKC